MTKIILKRESKDAVGEVSSYKEGDNNYLVVRYDGDVYSLNLKKENLSSTNSCLIQDNIDFFKSLKDIVSDFFGYYDTASDQIHKILKEADDEYSNTGIYVRMSSENVTAEDISFYSKSYEYLKDALYSLSQFKRNYSITHINDIELKEAIPLINIKESIDELKYKNVREIRSTNLIENIEEKLELDNGNLLIVKEYIGSSIDDIVIKIENKDIIAINENFLREYFTINFVKDLVHSMRRLGFFYLLNDRGLAIFTKRVDVSNKEDLLKSLDCINNIIIKYDRKEFDVYSSDIDKD